MPIDPQIPLGVQVPQINPVAYYAAGQNMADRRALEQQRQAQAQKIQQQQQLDAQIHQIMQEATNPETGNFNTAQAVQKIRAIGAWEQADKLEAAATKNVKETADALDAQIKARTAAFTPLREQMANMKDIFDSGRQVPPSLYQKWVTDAARTPDLGPQFVSSLPTRYDSAVMDHLAQLGQDIEARDKHISSIAALAQTKATTAKEQFELALKVLGDPSHTAEDNKVLLGGLEHGGNISPELAGQFANKDGKTVMQMGISPDARQTQERFSQERELKPFMVNGQEVMLKVDKQGNAYDQQTGQPVQNARPVPTQAMINVQAGNAPPPTISAAKPDAATANIVDKKTGMTPNAVYQTAIRYALTNEFPQMGRSSTDPTTRAARAAITGTAAAIADAAGTDLATVQQEYKMNSASLNKLGTIYNATAGAAGTANDNLDLVLGQIKNIPPEMMTSSPLVNRYSQWALGHELSGNKELTKLETYIYTAAREYGKVTSGSAGSVQGLTDSATKEAEKLISAANTKGQIEGAVEAMQNDMQNVTKNQLKQIKNVSGAVAAFLAKAHGETAPTGGGGKDPMGIR